MSCQECFKSNPNICITNNNHIITDFLHYRFLGRKYSVVHRPIKPLFCNSPSLWYHLLPWSFQEHGNLLGSCNVWRRVGCSTQSVSEASPFDDSTDNALRESMNRRNRSSGNPAFLSYQSLGKACYSCELTPGRAFSVPQYSQQRASNSYGKVQTFLFEPVA